MTSPKRTFREWEKAMMQKIMVVQNATQTICGVIMGTPLRQTAQEKLVAIDGLNALERQLTGELRRARRKHIARQKTMCQVCGEKRANWRTEAGRYLCTDCACKCHSTCEHTLRCDYCGVRINGWAGEETRAIYCSPQCALRASGYEPMTEGEL